MARCLTTNLETGKGLGGPQRCPVEEKKLLPTQSSTHLEAPQAGISGSSSSSRSKESSWYVKVYRSSRYLGNMLRNVNMKMVRMQITLSPSCNAAEPSPGFPPPFFPSLSSQSRRLSHFRSQTVPSPPSPSCWFSQGRNTPRSSIGGLTDHIHCIVYSKLPNIGIVTNHMSLTNE